MAGARTALVCAGERGRVLDLDNWRSRVWSPACAGGRACRAAPYDGRHTYASLLIHEGQALPYVTAALGHASATTTLDHYAHVFDEARLAQRSGWSRRSRRRAPTSSGGVCTQCVPAARVRVLRAAAGTP